jgi:hypothetical protein
MTCRRAANSALRLTRTFSEFLWKNREFVPADVESLIGESDVVGEVRPAVRPPLDIARQLYYDKSEIPWGGCAQNTVVIGVVSLRRSSGQTLTLGIC